MERDTFKTLSAGKFALSKLEDTIDKNQMLAFIEGAVFAWDYLHKTKKNNVEVIEKEKNNNEVESGQK
jgi:hypothetical protein